MTSLLVVGWIVDKNFNTVEWEVNKCVGARLVVSGFEKSAWC